MPYLSHALIKKELNNFDLFCNFLDLTEKERAEIILIRIENIILNIVNNLYENNKLIINLTKLTFW